MRTKRWLLENDEYIRSVWKGVYLEIKCLFCEKYDTSVFVLSFRESICIVAKIASTLVRVLCFAADGKRLSYGHLSVTGASLVIVITTDHHHDYRNSTHPWLCEKSVESHFLDNIVCI